MTNTPQEIFKQPPPPLPPHAIRLPATFETALPNGLEIVVVEDHRLPLVSYRLVLRSGDAHDPRELPGLVDFLTGLLTEGTASRTSREIADEVARIGATLQAGANSDYTTLAASSLTMFSEEILELLADVALRPAFPANEIELAKQNTKESLKQQRAQPSFLATEMVARVMFGEHPYSVTAPTPEAIDATTRERLIEFHRSRFVANNAVLIVAGDVKKESLLSRIEDLFGKWEPGSVVSDDFPAPPQRTSRAAYVVDRPGSAQANIVIANAGITRTSPDYFPLLVMHTVLGANASSRLFMNLREDKGYTYGAYSSLDARRTAGTFRAVAEVRTPVTGASLKEFFYELNRIRTEPVSEKELADAKSYLTGVFPIRLETQEGLIDQLVQIKMFGLPNDYLERYRSEVQSVTREQIQAVAMKYVRPDEAAIVMVGDGGQLTEQIQPFAEAIQFFNTAGKRKEKNRAASAQSAAIFAGTWSLEIDTPLGQSIPATLNLIQADGGLTGTVESEMGSGQVKFASIEESSLAAIVSLDVAGHTMEANIAAEITGDQMEGTINLQDAPALTFAGTRTAASQVA